MRSAFIFVLAPALLTAAPQTPSGHTASPADALVQNAVEAQKRGDLKSAIAAYRKALAMEPGLVSAHAGLGSALAAAGDLDGAIGEERRALALNPADARLRTALGLDYYRKGDLNNARRELEAVHQAHPDDLKAAVLLGFTYNKLQRESDTVALLAHIETGHESDLDLEYALGFAMLETGRHAEGITRIEKVAEARHAADAWMLAGRARFELQQFKAALADAQKAIEADASFPGAHTLAGQAMFATGDLEKATGEFQAALRQNPSDFTANLYLGIMRFDEHDLATAEPLLALALSIHPQDPLTRLEMARLRNMQGKTTDALVLLQGLEKSDPDWIDPHVDLATLYYKLHRPEDGLRERQLVKKLEDLQQKQGASKYNATPQQ
jgi:tetratricopeptide (TPR) repeat protein